MEIERLTIKQRLILCWQILKTASRSMLWVGLVEGPFGALSRRPLNRPAMMRRVMSF